MIINDKKIEVIVSVISDKKIEVEFFKNFFKEETIEIEQDEVDKKWVFAVFNSSIERELLNKLLFELTKNGSFELNIDSENAYVYERYLYNIGDNFVTKNFVEDYLNPINGKEHLANILFNSKTETISLEDLL